MTEESPFWRPCSTCKKMIPFGAVYYVCSVSTCNRPRHPLRFCSVDCWDAHLPLARHRSANAIEERAPRREDEAEHGNAPEGARPGPQSSPEILVVASRLKEYIRTRSGMHTSEGVLGPLSEHVRYLADKAVRNAAREGRKTVLDRDVPPVIPPFEPKR